MATVILHLFHKGRYPPLLAMEGRSPGPVVRGPRQAVKQGGRGITAIALAFKPESVIGMDQKYACAKFYVFHCCLGSVAHTYAYRPTGLPGRRE